MFIFFLFLLIINSDYKLNLTPQALFSFVQYIHILFNFNDLSEFLTFFSVVFTKWSFICLSSLYTSQEHCTYLVEHDARIHCVTNTPPVHFTTSRLQQKKKFQCFNWNILRSINLMPH